MRQILCPLVVGRYEELGLLQAALEEARAGRGRVVLLQGEAGVGKPRLTLQFEAAARSLGMRVLRGRQERRARRSRSARSPRHCSAPPGGRPS